MAAEDHADVEYLPLAEAIRTSIILALMTAPSKASKRASKHTASCSRLW